MSNVVFQYVKDTIWKQITTVRWKRWKNTALFFNTSKIQFESKSQLWKIISPTRYGCFSIRQRYNLKANHNCAQWHKTSPKVVFQYVKDTIWKQITTIAAVCISMYALFFNTSKIQFESKSQQRPRGTVHGHSCFSIRQRYNLKANHNFAWHLARRNQLFFNTSKIQFESKSQPYGREYYLGGSCFSIRQRYNLKANHNCRDGDKSAAVVVFQYVKDTIWKQITTVGQKIWPNCALFFNTSKIQFESKSQRYGGRRLSRRGCFSIRQRYNLKANHNYLFF